ncbi:MAG: metalloregulator ArsR/SmtB family transcription factor [Firmicutes bacterium]|jgi:ArsR family transcriptional regulator|nr:metalloregulator ArsR/SmtB family transcription factor [Bacillota bacterium]
MSVADTQVAVFKALAHPTRLKIVDILATEGGKCVCELVDRLGFDQSTVSKHLAVLKGTGIVRSSKEGLNVRYELETRCVHQFMKCIERIAAGMEAGCGIRCVGSELLGSPRDGKE